MTIPIPSYIVVSFMKIYVKDGIDTIFVKLGKFIFRINKNPYIASYNQILLSSTNFFLKYRNLSLICQNVKIKRIAKSKIEN